MWNSIFEILLTYTAEDWLKRIYQAKKNTVSTILVDPSLRLTLSNPNWQQDHFKFSVNVENQILDIDISVI